ncbi:hypothetical protein D7X25_16080 [bacterium 1XD42-8]|nr:hypothetical protein D7X25_16080 [bacterium 1XD42-8]
MKKIEIKSILQFLDKEGLEYEFFGNNRTFIQGFSSLANYEEETMTWVKSQEAKYNKEKKIKLCIVQKGVHIHAENIICSSNSKAIFFKTIDAFYQDKEEKEKIGNGTFIGKNVKIGKYVRIGHNCSIDGDITIGDNTKIANNVVISNRVIIGSNCEIQSLSVIGEDGFGYSEDEEHKKVMVKHYGGVMIGDDVFIGSHVNIARGTIDNTVIESGVKIAPTTHIGHNNIIERNSTVICSQLFGSVHTKENAYITSSVVRNQCTIGAYATVGMGSVVTKDVDDKKTVIGAPARELTRKAL